MNRNFLLCASTFCACAVAQAGPVSPADSVIRNARILTVDAQFSTAEALAIGGDKILAVGTDREIGSFIGPSTRVIDANGKLVLPGLYDSHVHSWRAAISEFNGPMPVLNSLAEAFQFIRAKAARQPPDSWIIL